MFLPKPLINFILLVKTDQILGHSRLFWGGEFDNHVSRVGIPASGFLESLVLGGGGGGF